MARTSNKIERPAPGPAGTTPSRLHSPALQLAVVDAASFVVWSGFGAILPYLPVFL